MIYGGWRHCNIVKLKKDFTGFESFKDGTTFKEITPKGYVEGPFMFIRNNKYYSRWSEGVGVARITKWPMPCPIHPLALSERIGTVLQQDSTVATGAGHHSVIQVPGKDQWLYRTHRRPLGENGCKLNRAVPASTICISTKKD